MFDFIANHYLWIKAFHLIAVFAWMAGLFYLPRIFVYMVEKGTDNDSYALLSIMAHRLLKIIMNPAMIIAWILGILLIMYHVDAGSMAQGWLHLKLTAVVCITIFHLILAIHLKKFHKGINHHSGRYFRIINEVPTILLVVIVIAVIVRPF